MSDAITLLNDPTFRAELVPAFCADCLETFFHVDIDGPLQSKTWEDLCVHCADWYVKTVPSND